MAKTAKVISGFPGVGKSVFFHTQVGGVLDSDSSSYSWKSNGVRNPNFPKNYMKHISSQIGKQDIIMVSSHAVVREALVEAGIEFTIVYPDISLKGEYLERYAKRKNTPAFIKLMEDKWEEFIAEIEAMEGTPGVKLLKLGSNQFLSNVLEEI